MTWPDRQTARVKFEPNRLAHQLAARRTTSCIKLQFAPLHTGLQILSTVLWQVRSGGLKFAAGCARAAVASSEFRHREFHTSVSPYAQRSFEVDACVVKLKPCLWQQPGLFQAVEEPLDRPDATACFFASPGHHSSSGSYTGIQTTVNRGHAHVCQLHFAKCRSPIRRIFEPKPVYSMP